MNHNHPDPNCLRCGQPIESPPQYHHAQYCKVCCDRRRAEIQADCPGIDMMTLATASNYKLRKMIVRFRAGNDKNAHNREYRKLVAFYKKYAVAVRRLRAFFGLYTGDDFWKLERKHDESMCRDLWRRLYGGPSGLEYQTP